MHVTHDPAAAASPTIDFNSFLAVDVRVGTIVDAKPFLEARKPAWRLWIDFGPVVSEVLTLGFPDANGKVVLVQPSKPVPNGGRLF